VLLVDRDHEPVVAQCACGREADHARADDGRGAMRRR
jgi:hypothetical protein